MSLRVRKNRTPPPPPVCPLTECMSLLGGAWTPNVIWYLSSGPRRFGELRADIPPISAKVLPSARTGKSGCHPASCNTKLAAIC